MGLSSFVIDTMSKPMKMGFFGVFITIVIFLSIIFLMALHKLLKANERVRN